MSRVPVWVWIVLSLPTLASIAAAAWLAAAGAIGRARRRRRPPAIDIYPRHDPRDNSDPL